jgi:hypothetical protein
MIGSGPIVIGQAAEFDYAGTQACRVLKEAGVNVVLCNSNPATIMTDQAMADEIYLEPLTTETVKRIIKKEKPDALLAGLGGQTGLTLAMKLDKEGFLKEQGVRLLGTNAAAISKAEDRELFKEAMEEIGQPCIASDIAETVDEALAVADRIGYPVIVRPAFTLGGGGGGAAREGGCAVGGGQGEGDLDAADRVVVGVGDARDERVTGGARGDAGGLQQPVTDDIDPADGDVGGTQIGAERFEDGAHQQRGKQPQRHGSHRIDKIPTAKFLQRIHSGYPFP